MSIERVAEDIEFQMRTDIRRTLHGHLGFDPRLHDMLLEELVDDGMYWVKHLLVQYACDEQRGMIDHG